MILVMMAMAIVFPLLVLIVCEVVEPFADSKLSPKDKPSKFNGATFSRKKVRKMVAM
ncbi:hypothetical protein [Escherichia phage pEC-N1203-2Af.1]|nr:hypothetical protein [Escherichia phage pEC-N1203-2Af.1]